MRRAVREKVGLMLWWLRADLRSVGPPTSKMYLWPEYRSTCYECFNATVRSSFFPPPSRFCFLFATVVYPHRRVRRSRKISVPHGAVAGATSMRQLGRRPAIIRAYVSSPPSELSRAKSVHLRPINYEYIALRIAL